MAGARSGRRGGHRSTSWSSVVLQNHRISCKATRQGSAPVVDRETPPACGHPGGVAAPPSRPAVRRPRAVRREPRARAARRPRPRAVGRAAPGPRGAARHDHRPDGDRCSASWCCCCGSRCASGRGSARSPTRSSSASSWTSPCSCSTTPSSWPGGWRCCCSACCSTAWPPRSTSGPPSGSGPRDGLMTGLVRRTGRSVRLVRTVLEVTVLGAGWLLGGTVGVGTVVYAVAIGPIAHALLPVVTVRADPSTRPRRRRGARRDRLGSSHERRGGR